LSTAQYTWLAFFIATSVYIAYLLPEQLHWFALVGFSFYYFLYIRFFSTGRINENDLVRQLAQDEQKLSTLNRDENDEVIVGLETKLNSLTGRLEAYVLESALFGALTFSGFLQIMSSELVTFDALEKFVNATFEASRAVIYFDVAGLGAAASSLNNKVSLFCIISVESLLCSVFFLAVIASRLRFSNVADKVRAAINLAKVYNEKEEAFYNEEDFSEKRSTRLVVLNAKVNEQLRETVAAMREVDPIITYMQYFRNAGIVVFLIILLSSTLFITNIVGWAILALLFATLLYFNRESIGRFFNVSYLNLRIKFSQNSSWFLAAALAPFLFASAIRDGLLLSGAHFLVAFGYLTTGLYIFLWLMLAAHVDNEFGEIEVDQERRRRWKVVKGMLAVLILAYTAAMAMKYLHVSGANAMILISLGWMSILLYFVGYYLAKIRWLGIVTGGLLATTTMGILFKSLHLPGANEMLLIAILTQAILTPIVLWQRKKFHILFVKFTTAAFLTGLIALSGIFIRYTVMISHRTWDAEEILEVMHSNLETDFARSLEKSNWYINEYGARPGFENVYAELVRQYRDYCWEKVGRAKTTDSTALNQALVAARQSNKIQSLFRYNFQLIETADIGLEADILLQMRQREEARRSLERILNENPPEEVREIIGRKIKGIDKLGG
jgi:hypothetical protein